MFDEFGVPSLVPQSEIPMAPSNNMGATNPLMHDPFATNPLPTLSTTNHSIAPNNSTVQEQQQQPGNPLIRSNNPLIGNSTTRSNPGNPLSGNPIGGTTSPPKRQGGLSPKSTPKSYPYSSSYQYSSAYSSQPMGELGRLSAEFSEDPMKTASHMATAATHIAGSLFGKATKGLEKAAKHGVAITSDIIIETQRSTSNTNNSDFGGKNTSLYEASVDENGPPLVYIDESKAVYIKIPRTETKISFLLQEYTDYIVEIYDFGKMRQILRRFSDFHTLHKDLSPLDLNLPILPQKGLDSTDPIVVEDRRAKLTLFLQYCLDSECIRLEKNLYLWKFLEFESAGLSVSRFVLGPEFVRSNLYKSLPKLCSDEKYQNDLYRLGHPEFLKLCILELISSKPEYMREAAQLLSVGVKIITKNIQTRNTQVQTIKNIIISIGGRRRNNSGNSVGGENDNNNNNSIGTNSGDINTNAGDGFFLKKMLFLLGSSDENFIPVRSVLSSILVALGNDFPSMMSPVIITNRDAIIELLNTNRPSNVHELISKIIWFSLEEDLRKWLFSEQGLLIIVYLFQSHDRHTNILACLVTAVAIVSGNVDPNRSIELQTKMDTVWPECTNETILQNDPQISKLCGSMCTHASSLQRVNTILIDPRFAQYGLWMLRKAQLGMKSLQQLTGSLTTILELKDHPCRYQAAELLLRVFPEGEVFEGLPHFEESLERAILDPLSHTFSLQTVEISKLKQHSDIQIEFLKGLYKQNAEFNQAIAELMPPEVDMNGNPIQQQQSPIPILGAIQNLGKLMQSYGQIQSELRQNMRENASFAQELLAYSQENLAYSQNSSGREIVDGNAAGGGGDSTSQNNNQVYIDRLKQLEANQSKVSQMRDQLKEKDTKLQELHAAVSEKQKNTSDLQQALVQLDQDIQSKGRLVENAKQMLQTKRTQAQGNTEGDLSSLKQKYEQIIERQKNLAMLHMKVQQGDAIDITPYLTQPGLAAVSQGRNSQIKVEHQHWKSQGDECKRQIDILSQIDPQKLQNEIVHLERQILETETTLNGELQPRKQQLGVNLAELKVTFESERQTYLALKQQRDDLHKEILQIEVFAKHESQLCMQLIKEKREKLNKLMGISKGMTSRQSMLEAKLTGISVLLESERNARINLKKSCQNLTKVLQSMEVNDITCPTTNIPSPTNTNIASNNQLQSSNSNLLQSSGPTTTVITTSNLIISSETSQPQLINSSQTNQPQTIPQIHPQTIQPQTNNLTPSNNTNQQPSAPVQTNHQAPQPVQQQQPSVPQLQPGVSNAATLPTTNTTASLLAVGSAEGLSINMSQASTAHTDATMAPAVTQETTSATTSGLSPNLLDMGQPSAPTLQQQPAVVPTLQQPAVQQQPPAPAVQQQPPAPTTVQQPSAPPVQQAVPALTQPAAVQPPAPQAQQTVAAPAANNSDLMDLMVSSTGNANTQPNVVQPPAVQQMSMTPTVEPDARTSLDFKRAADQATKAAEDIFNDEFFE